jgi:hypothetical protein
MQSLLKIIWLRGDGRVTRDATFVVILKIQITCSSLVQWQKLFGGIIAICFQQRDRPSNYVQFWEWIKKALPGMRKLLC